MIKSSMDLRGAPAYGLRSWKMRRSAARCKTSPRFRDDMMRALRSIEEIGFPQPDAANTPHCAHDSEDTR